MLKFVKKHERSAQEIIASFPSVIAVDGHCVRHAHPNHSVIIVKPGESGYWAPPYAEGLTLAEVDEKHERLFDARRPTEAERQAAQIGSMAGWSVPGADPLNYEDDEPDTDFAALAAHAYGYAEQHYGDKDARFDVIVECMSKSEIADELKEQGIKDYAAAEEWAKGVAGLQHEKELNQAWDGPESVKSSSRYDPAHDPAAPLPVTICTGCSTPQACREAGWCTLREDA